jgi:hypothetical protein
MCAPFPGCPFFACPVFFGQTGVFLVGQFLQKKLDPFPLDLQVLDKYAVWECTDVFPIGVQQDLYSYGPDIECGELWQEIVAHQKTHKYIVEDPVFRFANTPHFQENRIRQFENIEKTVVGIIVAFTEFLWDRTLDKLGDFAENIDVFGAEYVENGQHNKVGIESINGHIVCDGVNTPEIVKQFMFSFARFVDARNDCLIVVCGGLCPIEMTIYE